MKPFFFNASISLGILILLLGGVFLWMIWWGLTPHTHESIKPVPREAAIKHIKSDFFPKNAHNIQYSFSAYQVSPNFESFIRYQAPAEDCIALAKSQFPNIPLQTYNQEGTKNTINNGKECGLV